MKDIPKLYNVTIEEINEPLILGIINIASLKKEFVITPLSILRASGFPISNQTEVLNNKAKTRKIKRILVDLKNKQIITKRKSKHDYLGIKETAYNFIEKKIAGKSIEQLENDYWKEPAEFPSGLVLNCYLYRKIPVNELNVEQLRLLISQKIGLEFLVGIGIEKLKTNVLAEGDLYEGDLLVAISNVPTEYWYENQNELWTIEGIIKRKSHVIKSELGDKEFDHLSERISASRK